MKVIVNAIISLFLSIALFAQPNNTNPGNANTNGNNTNPATTNGNNTNPGNNTTTPATNNNNNQGGNGAITGFDNINWGDTYEEVKDRFRTLAASGNVQDPLEIVSDKPDREILIRRRGILYRYLFYKKPLTMAEKKAKEAMEQDPSTAATAPDNTNNQPQTREKEANFFFIEVNFNLVPAETLYKKLEQKYGSRTKNTLNDDKQGAYIWEKENGTLVQWIQPFNEKTYTRTLYYVSNKIREEIKKDLQEYRFEVELDNLKQVIP